MNITEDNWYLIEFPDGFVERIQRGDMSDEELEAEAELRHQAWVDARANAVPPTNQQFVDSLISQYENVMLPMLEDGVARGLIASKVLSAVRGGLTSLKNNVLV